MSDTTIIDRDDLGTASESRPTKGDLIERGLGALDVSKTSSVKVSAVAGGVSFASALEIIEFSKLMAVSGKAVPKFLRGNPGGCLAITFQAVSWRMDPFQVANKSYEVNDRIGYESQLIHAIIEARAPLQHRLECEYDGENGDRVCIVRGHFTSGDTREYRSPKLKDIHVKNSPLWKDDPDQQLFYYASRSWARKWCPDVIMGVYSREELARDNTLGREEDEAPGLHARLVGTDKGDEGHKPGHVESELSQIAPNNKGVITVTSTDEGMTVDPPEAAAKPTRKGKKTKIVAEDAKPLREVIGENLSEKDVGPASTPKTVKQYIAYAKAWIKACDNSDEMFKQWRDERKLRNDIGITSDDRAPLDELIAERREQLEK